MKKLPKTVFLLVFAFWSLNTIGQKKQCGCAIDSTINENTELCNTKFLKNGAKLYYQFNCDSVWLTLETKSRRKMIIYSMGGGEFKLLHSYNYRLGYQFSKEYDKYLLFRSGCPANGPCNFLLVKKSNGKTVRELGELIYNFETGQFYPFLLYFADHRRLNYLTMYYVDSGKKYRIRLDPTPEDEIVPENQFSDITVKNNVLSLTYWYIKADKVQKKTTKINLLKYHQ